ncbi:MAG: Proposed peptidoglycan lipid II flippase MurJ [uncultured Thermoleophilia bacterium]|uniref:Probable lipid II flippase MurJ n=1 Tax=uncultured Thermoleophilia bacterium TaxID=1497501 RepID=A0A6J4TUX4_9ACTN|nr:MAG: Proposed peptidoglycan lipid II flippase MurJ [uncultured Thermoleophilia bacterium]
MKERLRTDVPESPGAPPRARRLAVSAALFSLATGLSRVLGLAREVVAAALLGLTGGPATAFTVAGQVPNVVRSFVADAALGAAFVPVFADLIDRGERARAWRVASTLLTLTVLVLTLVTVLFELSARAVLEALGFGDVSDLTVLLARILFPTVVLLGLSGIVSAMLNAFDEFVAPAIAPVYWNLTILVFLLVGFLLDDAGDQVTLYAVGVLVGTAVQFLTPLRALRGRGGRLRPALGVRDPLVRRVLLLMGPITLGLGLINVNLAIAVWFADRDVLDVAPLTDYWPAAIDKAFRVYMLPQGMFSVAVAAVLFPTLARLATAGEIPAFRRQFADGVRQIVWLLVPASVVCAVLAEPMIRLLYQHGAFTAEQTPGVAQALAAFSLGLAANGVILLLNRSFFSLQRPWLPTLVALANLAITTALLAALYRTGWGIPLATSLANLVQLVLLWVLLRRRVGPLHLRAVLDGLARTLACSAVLGAAAWAVWWTLDALLGRSFGGQVVALGAALTVGGAVYLGASRLARLPEVALVTGLLRRRMRRAPTALGEP